MINKFAHCVAIVLIVIIATSCSAANTSTPSPFEWVASFDGRITEYQDVRFVDLTELTEMVDRDLIETLDFNTSTEWRETDRKVADEVLELGMNAGLGIRYLHAQGLTGAGVNVAIIDQNMIPGHPEFKDKIIEYYDVGTGQSADQGSMHGPAVTSLLVGENIGTAPGARVYYAAAPSWLGDAQYYADALNWIIDENEQLPDDQKIRVVSVSAAPSGPGSLFTENTEAWDQAYQKATDAGILILDCTSDHVITAPCYLDLNNPDDVTKCTPGWPGKEFPPMADRIYVPTSRRTTAEQYNKGEYSYQYTGRGGMSWATPYLSGILALGWQVNPQLSNSEILELLFASAYRNDEGLAIINPVAFIEMVQSTVRD